MNAVAGPSGATTGDDRLLGAEGNDVLSGLVGNDAVVGLASNDMLHGDEGDDRLTGGPDNDRIEGGAGYDIAMYASASRQARIGLTNTGLVVTGPDGTDTMTGVEQVQFTDARFVIDPDSAGARIQRIYDAVFHRTPEQAGLEHWLDALDEGGQTIGQVADFFFRSFEFQASGTNVAGNGAFVDFLYNRILGRTADAEGRAGWMQRLQEELARSDALLFFSENDEHRALAAATVARGYLETDDASQTIALLYDTFLDRRPDAAGLAGWAEQLRSGARSLADIARLFAASDEFREKTGGLSDGQLVDFMYRSTLDRDPEPVGKARWLHETGIVAR